MTVTQLNVAVLGAGPAGLSCARHLQSDVCSVTVFDPARAQIESRGVSIRQGATVCDIWHEEGWRLASMEEGAYDVDYDVLVLALPAPQSAALLESLLPATAQQVASMAPAKEQCIWVPAVRVGLCGDWLSGGAAGDAWLSGRALAGHLLATLTTSLSNN
ncbi:NAD(P)-binding protein [Pseudoduganella sp. FT26W]|uniref:NAD(P)-binding protein n=1 Tax=Duganella aquatilis TaxID=2666082 RepID=A0A844CXI0_9BURK|nr:NAD(P)-binding protein [Duganella aquatilis]MRW84598.1 NAD(P)-binding protein [Duganella aquatilis]